MVDQNVTRRLDEARRIQSDLSVNGFAAIIHKLHPEYRALFLAALRRAGLPE